MTKSFSRCLGFEACFRVCRFVWFSFGSSCCHFINLQFAGRIRSILLGKERSSVAPASSSLLVGLAAWFWYSLFGANSTASFSLICFVWKFYFSIRGLMNSWRLHSAIVLPQSWSAEGGKASALRIVRLSGPIKNFHLRQIEVTKSDEGRADICFASIFVPWSINPVKKIQT